MPGEHSTVGHLGGGVELLIRRFIMGRTIFLKKKRIE